MPGNQVGDEIPGAPVSGTRAPELHPELGSIFLRLAETEKQVGYNQPGDLTLSSVSFQNIFWGRVSLYYENLSCPGKPGNK